ncbi:aurora kinase A and ninein-interacting protein [Pseudoliparis swirei]|uniref:aurora kinase A and ninein-interacting protein n=1 Tax=Pseudoliparis swirei TaxID=2059687 RepID=UPI0024BE1876|nr:aurora kinase A and ninein-interacting protein [Pseudoliparis swirei]
MKTSKPAQHTSAQEECGVWLDTVQLKGKAKQKRVARPISKMLNPFAEGSGYSLAVALNFTQTKMEMPKTKQSSISTFFAPQGRVFNKMSSSEVPNMDPVQPSSSSTSATNALTAPNPIVSGTKRRLEMLDLYNSEPGVNHEWKRDQVTEAEAALCQEQAAEEQIEEIHPPRSKRGFIAASLLPGDSQPLPQVWSQDPLLTWSQYSEGEFSPTKKEQKNSSAMDVSDSEPTFLNSRQSEDVFGIQINLEDGTSIQKSFKHFHSSQTDQEKANRFLSFMSPRKRSTLSHIEPLSDCKCTEPETASPRKHAPLCMWERADKEQSLESQFKWTKPSTSPLKRKAPKLSCREVGEDSLAMLFTQDSEGFRVIAHRGLQARNPLRDKSNISSVMGRTSAYKSPVEEEEEDEMLFTQDSQGNMVIKH